MKVSIFQFSPSPGDVQGNCSRVMEAIKSASKEKADLLILPELWTCGIAGSRESCHAETTEGILKTLQGSSRENGMFIGGGMPEPHPSDRTLLYNTFFLTSPDGSIHSCRKMHLFGPMGEDRVFTPGSLPGTFSIEACGRKLIAGAAICYDLRFPELTRRLAVMGAEIILISALWPMARRSHLELLSRARAVENQCFVVLANGYGMSGDTELAGASAIYAPDGRSALKADDRDGLFTAEIDLEETAAARAKFLTALPEKIWDASTETKLLELEELKEITGIRKRAGQKMVFTNGCFDIIHPGHTAYLKEARNLGDFLVLGLNSDSSVKEIKGPARPINSEKERAAVLSALSSIDYITIFSQATPLELINELKPDILVKGADWKEEEVVGADVVKKAGGMVKLISFTHETSTTGTISRIRDNCTTIKQ